MTKVESTRENRKQMKTNPNIFAEIVSGGYCIGCGGCATVSPKIRMQFDQFGMYKPVATAPMEDSELSATGEVCPFLGGGNSEDSLAKERYAADSKHDPVVGYHLKNFAGHVSEGRYRAQGSSGGFGTWLPVQLLESGIVDAVIHVKECDASLCGQKLFQYDISTTAAEVQEGAKSRYYPIEISSVIERVKREPRRYVFVGLPCFVKTIRLLQKTDAVLAERIPYCIGIVCGHLKSKYYGEFLAWQSGVSPDELVSLDFRHKEPDNPAKGYVLRAVGKRGENEFEVKRPVSGLVGGNWGLGYFKIGACDYCDDVFAECADVALGDAWLPEYENERDGTSLLVVRSKAILEIVETANSRGQLQLDEVATSKAVDSQSAGVRHRREGLAYRLFLKAQTGKWVPEKRVNPSDTMPLEARLKYSIRVKLLEKSHSAYLKARSIGNTSVFKKEMRPLVLVYSVVIAMARIKSKVVRWVKTSKN